MRHAQKSLCGAVIIVLAIGASSGGRVSAQVPIQKEEAREDSVAKDQETEDQGKAEEEKAKDRAKDNAKHPNDNLKDRNEEAKAKDADKTDRKDDGTAKAPKERTRKPGEDGDDGQHQRKDSQRHKDQSRSRSDRNDPDRRRDDPRKSQEGRTDDHQANTKNFGLSFSAGNDGGLKVSEIASDSVAARAGVRDGDVIHSVNGNRITSDQDFSRWINAGESRDPIRVIVIRDGRQETVLIRPSTARLYRAPANGGAYLGVTMDRRYPGDAFVKYVTPNSPADRADLRVGDLILSVDGKKVESPSHLTELISRFQPDDEVELEISSGDDNVDSLTVVLGVRPAPRSTTRSQPRGSDQDAQRNDDHPREERGRTARDRDDDQNGNRRGVPGRRVPDR